ncbi:hypothetical protein KKH36_02560 [Patescibacteria group bacterium]|nr:hypothetical protein [Patescibacteria group bacterium]
MKYEFGEIIDCRNSPTIKHFILILGETRRNEVMYYLITSRTYKVFRDLLDFFNDCIEKKNKRFFIYFGKEKNKSIIYPTGNLCDAFFLDKHFAYQGCLEKDSMIIINEDPKTEDKEVLTSWKSEGMASLRDKLNKQDSEKLILLIRRTENIRPRFKTEIGRNYNISKRC